MNIDNLLHNLPPFKQNINIKNAVTEYAAKFMNCKETDILFETPCKEIFEFINETTKCLIRAEKAFLSGDIISCHTEIANLIYQQLNQFNLSCKIETGKIFYRMRENNTGYLYSKEEMFHIPFGLNRLVGNQRFSVAGHPSLYLGNSIYVCWEECNRPKFDTANVVALRTKRELKLLDLRMPTAINSIDVLYRIPLIIASSIKTKDSNSPFKPEYIISQAILHAIVNQNRKSNERDYDGVIYYSTRLSSNQKLFNNNELFENIVIPTGSKILGEGGDYVYFEDGFCPVLCNHFEISKTISQSIQKMTERTTIFDDGGLDDEYKASVLGSMEFSLSTNTKWENISPNKFFRINPSELNKY
ncbi:MAG: RES domain-containing protein [Methylococcales bacterium]